MKKKGNESVLGKRKLDYTYSGFISSTCRPPLASPHLCKWCDLRDCFEKLKNWMKGGSKG